LFARLKRPRYINKWTNNLKKQTKKIDSLIEGWCKKKLVFAYPLLPFRTVGEAYVHCTHKSHKPTHRPKFVNECNLATKQKPPLYGKS